MPNLNVDDFDKTKISEKLKVATPEDGREFLAERGEETKLITIKGELDKKEVGKGRKILVVIKTDRNYPQALGLAKEKWEFRECRLGGVDHGIFAVLLDFEDRPLLRSRSINVRLKRQ